MSAPCHFRSRDLREGMPPAELGLEFTTVRRVEPVPGGRALFETRDTVVPHPNVGSPAGRICYVYCMTATVPGKRQFMDLRIQKEYGETFE